MSKQVRFRRRKKIATDCHYCGKPCGKGYTWDHIVPTSLGGSNTVDNIVPACNQCNHKKDNKISDCDCGKCWYAIKIWRQTYEQIS